MHGFRRSLDSVFRLALVAVVFVLTSTSDTGGTVIVDRSAEPSPRARTLEYLPPGQIASAVRAAVARGEIDDPAARPRLPVPPRAPRAPHRGDPILTPDDIFAYEDTEEVLLTDFSNGQLIQLMIDAANAIMLTHGDNFDFIGYWVNFPAHHQIGAAFYAGIENDVMGIGDASGEGTPLFDYRDELNLFGSQVEGFVMMWNVNSSSWQPGTGPNADFTRLALAQEFEHRFALFLPDLLDGRSMQGNNGNCGRIFHWNWRADGQGSGMEISEWVGDSPPVLEANFISFNTDIPGGVFSYSDLYLMGYVSPGEMDAGNSELRYMDGSNCAEGSSYFGPVSAFTSADIIASAGPRIPDDIDEDKHYRTAWVMIHRPGDPPSALETGKAIDILQQHQTDWNASTLGRGTMDNSLGPVVAVPGAPVSASSVWLGTPRPNPLRTRESHVRYTLTEGARVRLSIHDVAGRRVATPVSGWRGAGEHTALWDGTNDTGERVTPGVYFLLLEAGDHRAARRITVVD